MIFRRTVRSTLSGHRDSTTPHSDPREAISPRPCLGSQKLVRDEVFHHGHYFGKLTLGGPARPWEKVYPGGRQGPDKGYADGW